MHADLTPRQIVAELDKYIIGQTEAKKSVAIALRNRWRRLNAPPEMRDEIMPNNIIMIGPTGVGKTEIARRLARLSGAPFTKVEATKFTEVGYVGRDVDSMIRDLTDISINMVREEHTAAVQEKARELAEDRILDLLIPPAKQSTGEFTTGPGLEEMGVNLQDLFGSLGGKKRKKRRMKIEEARTLLAQEEAQKLIDMDKVTREAITRVEQSGIVFIDEIDKVASRSAGGRNGPDVSREGVQRDLLPIVEGSGVMTKYGMVKTDHILFIASGAFHVSRPSDLIPELQGRFPIRVELKNLTEDDFYKILTQPKNALIKQYQALLASEGVTIEFTDDAVRAIAHTAAVVNEQVENIGARRLHTILTTLLEDILYDVPDNLRETRVVADSDLVQTKLTSVVEDRDLSQYIL